MCYLGSGMCDLLLLPRSPFRSRYFKPRPRRERQRFGSAMNLNPHFHSFVVDGVFNEKNTTIHNAPPLMKM